MQGERAYPGPVREDTPSGVIRIELIRIGVGKRIVRRVESVEVG